MSTPKIVIEHLHLAYGDKPVLKDVSLQIAAHSVTAIIGPSGCGKSTLLRCMNRLFDLMPDVRIRGRVLLDGHDVFAPDVDLVRLRRRVGMVFQKPNPFPKSVYENVAFGLRINGVRGQDELDGCVAASLKAAGLWDEVSGRLHESAVSLSGGQQQRLCIARAVAIEPDVILMDEPCSALDPASTYRIEELMRELKQKYTIVLVTHNMQQAARASDYTAFLYMGKLIEFGRTEKIFTSPREKLTEDYISGRFG
ncbi:MAG: phosphate ABC transporter ATP-binding protein PstB [Candidatus Sumerlaeia bacterium]